MFHTHDQSIIVCQCVLPSFKPSSTNVSLFFLSFFLILCNFSYKMSWLLIYQFIYILKHFWILQNTTWVRSKYEAGHICWFKYQWYYTNMYCSGESSSSNESEDWAFPRHNISLSYYCCCYHNYCHCYFISFSCVTVYIHFLIYPRKSKCCVKNFFYRLQGLVSRRTSFLC